MPLPLPALLSQALVAFTIEFDNEAERRVPHQTTNHGGTPGAPWLVSLVMWSNCLQFLSGEGITARELERRARTPANLNGMQRWGYIIVGPDKLIRATPAGRKAREIRQPLFDVIERRWNAHQLREWLEAFVNQIDLDLPDCLPILGYGLFSRATPRKRTAPLGHLPLSALLSRALLAFALEFERESDLSLAICANVLRVLDENGIRLRDIPRISGVSKESIAMAMGILRKEHLVIEESRMVRLNSRGLEAQRATAVCVPPSKNAGKHTHFANNLRPSSRN
jgi:Mn-dependent DtxR family transcriptional regulator